MLNLDRKFLLYSAHMLPLITFLDGDTLPHTEEDTLLTVLISKRYKILVGKLLVVVLVNVSSTVNLLRRYFTQARDSYIGMLGATYFNI